LCSDGIDFVRGVSNIDVTIMENDGGISKDEVSGAIDITFFVELSFRMNEKSVLITLKATSIEN